MHFNLFIIDTGHHEASWRLPGSDPLANTDVEHYEQLARTAEAAKFDSVFLADSPVLWNDPGRRPSGRLEPVTLLTALARATQRIGLIATASTSYNDPYNLARRFASLDHISGGRAGWNIVTTAGDDAARNFGLDAQPAHAERYQRAAEFIEVSRKLWDSWEDDAVVADKSRGVHAEADRVHAIEHAGRFFRVRGPLDVPRSPQGHPVLVQAGSSEDGKQFAARYAEAVFTAQQTLAQGQAFYADLKQRAAAGPARSPARPSRWPSRSRTGARTARRTGSTSCPRCCRPGWSCSLRTWCRSCSGVACSAPSTRARRCGSTTGWPGRAARTPPAGSR
jgi:FMN-dependent oxidoreductase (nitrilotriacetate monooxygenase family)